MISALLVLRLQHAAQRLTDRLTYLEAQLQDDQVSVWSEYRETAKAIAEILPRLEPGQHGALMTTREMAAKLGISSKTVLRRKRAGEVRPALVTGKRGPAALRWRG